MPDLTEILHNPGRTDPVPALAATGDRRPRDFHRRLPGYAPTPLREAPALAAELGIGRLWVKDETMRLGLPAFKVLGASWATYRLLCDRLGREPEWSTLADLAAAIVPLGPLQLVAATDGNHGRAVAWTARQLGLAAHILVPAGTAAARLDAIAGEGATTEVVDGTYDDAIAASAALAADTALVVSDTSWPGYAEVPAWVIEGYSTIFDEVDEQLAALSARRVDAVSVPMGVGALTAAAVAHERTGAADDPRWLLAVEPLSAACGLRSAAAGQPTTVPGPHRSIMAGLNCGNVSLLAWPVVAAGIDLFVAIDDAAAEQAMRDLAAIAVPAGETGAASLAGLRALLEAEPGALGDAPDVLVLVTEGPTDPENYARVVG